MIIRTLPYMAVVFPMFPLNLVVYPGENLRLHIFEPRYKQLINECLSDHKNFGIPTIIDKKLLGIGTEVEIQSVDKKYPGGELDISTVGVKRLKVEHFYKIAEGKLYPGAEISWLTENAEQTHELIGHVKDLLKRLHQALGITKKFAETPKNSFSYEIGHHIGLSLKQEYHLLTLNQESKRLSFIKKHLETILPVVMETERLKARAKLNGHYKNVIPPK